MPTKRYTKAQPKKTQEGRTRHAFGQYRIDVDGTCMYFGTDPKTADERYRLYTTTNLRWDRRFRQYIKIIDNSTRAFGTTVEEARSNYERFISERWQNSPLSEPAPIILDSASLATLEFSVNTVEDMANAYVAWCIANRSEKHALDAKSVFRHLAAHLGRN